MTPLDGLHPELLLGEHRRRLADGEQQASIVQSLARWRRSLTQYRQSIASTSGTSWYARRSSNRCSAARSVRNTAGRSRS